MRLRRAIPVHRGVADRVLGLFAEVRPGEATSALLLALVTVLVLGSYYLRPRAELELVYDGLHSGDRRRRAADHSAPLSALAFRQPSAAAA